MMAASLVAALLLNMREESCSGSPQGWLSRSHSLLVPIPGRLRDALPIVTRHLPLSSCMVAWS